MMSAYPIVCFVFIPVYFSLGITSVYQYLDLRYVINNRFESYVLHNNLIFRFNSRLVRCLASGTYIVRQILNLGVTIYAPTVALNTIIGIPYYASLIGMTTISIIFNILVISGDEL
jgi:solute carrier family 5 (sodium-coupled monocarboxylate transporter), member 8/12